MRGVPSNKHDWKPVTAGACRLDPVVILDEWYIGSARDKEAYTERIHFVEDKLTQVRIHRRKEAMKKQPKKYFSMKPNEEEEETVSSTKDEL